MSGNARRATCASSMRKEDLISVSGFKVFPNELEEVADLHPGVLKPAQPACPARGWARP